MNKTQFLLAGAAITLAGCQYPSTSGFTMVSGAPTCPVGQAPVHWLNENRWGCVPLPAGFVPPQPQSPQQALSSSPLPGESPDYHQQYTQNALARYRQSVQLCNQMQANGTLGNDTGRYQDCMTEAREQLQWDKDNEGMFAARNAEKQAQAPAEAQALQTGQLTPLMLEVCHAYAVYGPERCAQAYPIIEAQLRSTHQGSAALKALQEEQPPY